MNRSRYRDKSSEKYNNRINFLIAIVFLFTIVISYKLYDVQVSKHDLYSAKANSQHQIYKKLEPNRGEIFIEDYMSGIKERTLYPLATNKDFALIFAVPKDLKNPEEVAMKLFQIFDLQNVQKEVDKYFEEKDKEELVYALSLVTYNDEEERIKKEAEARYNFNLLRSDSVCLELIKEKK